MFVITYTRGSNPDVDTQQEILVRSLPSENTVVGSYSDLAIGTDPARPGLAAAMEHLATGGAQALCVSSLDRVARRADQLAGITQWFRDRSFEIQETPENVEGG